MLQSQKQDKHSKTAFSLLLENLGSDIRELSDHKNLLFSHIYLFDTLLLMTCYFGNKNKMLPEQQIHK